MATEQQLVPDLSLKAAEDLDTYQFYIVGVDTSGTALLADGSEAAPIGPLQNKPKSGQAAQIRHMGVSKVKFGGSVTAGSKLKASSGKAVATTTNNDWYIGIALSSGSTNEIGTMLCVQGYIGA